jgi:mRNA-degrading endonuclease RelE of RelBE toxin-antitoxin system
MYRVFLSRNFQKQFRALPKGTQTRVREALAGLVEDPLKCRPKMDIKALKDTEPTKHRLRVGDFRIVYLVESRTVKVIDLFKRGRGCR